MGELRHRRAERFVQHQLFRRVRDVIVAADHMRHLHLDVVGHDREMVGGMAVGAEDDEVFEVGAVELDRAVDEIVETQRPIRRLDANRAGAVFAFTRGNFIRRQTAAGAIVAPRAGCPFPRPRASP